MIPKVDPGYQQVCSVVELLVTRGAKTHQLHIIVPNGTDGDLVAGFLQTRGSKPVTLQ